MDKELIKEKSSVLDDYNEFDFDRGDMLEDIDITTIVANRQDTIDEQ